MMHRKPDVTILSFLYKPFCIAVILIGLFGLIWLRSGTVKVAYQLRALEEKKMETLKEMKMLLAERAQLMSLENIGISMMESRRGDKLYAENRYVFPARTRIIKVTNDRRPEPFNASLQLKRKK